jgi:hypothetical protein
LVDKFDNPLNATQAALSTAKEKGWTAATRCQFQQFQPLGDKLDYEADHLNDGNQQ